MRLRVRRRSALALSVTLALRLVVAEGLALARITLSVTRGGREGGTVDAAARRARRHDLGVELLVRTGEDDRAVDRPGGDRSHGHGDRDARRDVGGERGLETGKHGSQVERVEE